LPEGALDIHLQEAPLFADVCLGDTPGAAYWTETQDGLRLRLGLFRAPHAKGTVLLFPGRTEYIEKYAQSADELAQRNLSTLVIDWRGQGLADRMLDDTRIGHVDSFDDYQTDIRAMMSAAEALSLPRPFYLLSHSMGGCIALRALHEGLDVTAAAFTAPMWGIRISLPLRPVAFVLKYLLPSIGLGHITPPTTVPEPYVLHAPFKTNTLTRDPEMWEAMRQQIGTHPQISLGGPSIIWLREALAECDALAAMPSPDTPCLTFLGTDERIVHTGRIHARMKAWRSGVLECVEGARHEVLMENAALRKDVFDQIARHFETAGSAARSA